MLVGNSPEQLIEIFMAKYNAIDSNISKLEEEKKDAIAELQYATQLGDLSENAEHTAAADRLTDITLNIENLHLRKQTYTSFFEHIRNIPKDEKTIGIGATVTISSEPIYNSFGGDVCILIVPKALASPIDCIVSDTSPVVRNISGVQVNNGAVTRNGITIKEVKYDFCNIPG